MKYKIGTFEEYLSENPVPVNEGDPSQKRRWQNEKKDNEYLWANENGTITEDEKFDLVSIWTNSIIKPTSIKYYINKNGHYTAGIVETGKVMQSGLRNLEIFNNKEDWIARANELNIIIESDD